MEPGLWMTSLSDLLLLNHNSTALDKTTQSDF